MTGAGLAVAAVVAGLLGAAWLWRGGRRRSERSLADPSVDPGAPPVGGAAHDDRIIEDPLSAFIDHVRAILDGTDPDRPWRGPLRPLVVHLPTLVGAGEPGLAAEVLARLGHLPEALDACRTLPEDDACACFVRSLRYRVNGDRERAESALVAAVSLARPGDRERFRRALLRHRDRFPRRRSDAERLWDPA